MIAEREHYIKLPSQPFQYKIYESQKFQKKRTLDMQGDGICYSLATVTASFATLYPIDLFLIVPCIPPFPTTNLKDKIVNTLHYSSLCTEFSHFGR